MSNNSKYDLFKYYAREHNVRYNAFSGIFSKLSHHEIP